jgi:hypothetical protein
MNGATSELALPPPAGPGSPASSRSGRATTSCARASIARPFRHRMPGFSIDAPAPSTNFAKRGFGLRKISGFRPEACDTRSCPDGSPPLGDLRFSQQIKAPRELPRSSDLVAVGSGGRVLAAHREIAPTATVEICRHISDNARRAFSQPRARWLQRSSAKIADGIAHGTDGEKHRCRGRTSIRPTFYRLDCDKSIFRVEGPGARFGIYDHSHASVLIGHPQRQPKHEPKKLQADSLALGRMVDSEASEPEHRERVTRKFSAGGEWQIIDFDMRRGNGGIPEDASVLDSDVRDAEVVAKLVLSGELMKEAVEIGVARMKRRSVVALAKRSDLNHRAGCARPVTPSLSPPA